MKPRFFDMIDTFARHERERAADEAEAFARETLERFAGAVDALTKDGAWRVSELGAEEAAEACRRMREGEHDMPRIKRRRAAVVRFFREAAAKGWVPGHVAEEIAAARVRHKKPHTNGREYVAEADEKTRARVLEELAAMRRGDFINVRDRVLRGLALIHRAGCNELSRCNLADYDGTALALRSSFVYRCRVLELLPEERQYLDAYLMARAARGVKDADALFVGRCGKRLSRNRIHDALVKYEEE